MYRSNINLNLYKTFYDVAKLGSISKAANASFTSQPAISKAIKKLEEELNTQLFIRTINGVELTKKGEELFIYVEKSYNNLILGERHMVEEENLTRGSLKIGMPSNIGSFLLFDKIISFHKKYPKIEITIITGKTSTLANLLNSHEVDFVIDTAPINAKLDKGITIKKLLDVEYCFIKKKNSVVLDNKKIKTLKDLENIPLVLPIPATANRNDLDELCQKEKIFFTNVLNIHTTEMIIAAVKNDLGIGYVIKNLVLKEENIEIIPLKNKLPTAEIDIIYDEALLSNAPQKFIENYLKL